MRLRLWLMPLAAVLLVLVAGALARHSYVEYERNREKLSVLERLSTLRARLEGAIGFNLQLTQGLVAEIALNPGIDQADFTRYARVLDRQSNQLRNIAAARDMVITHMYPLKDNEAAIGVDYRHIPGQSAAALRARDTGRMVVDGPLPLVQGGTGLIGRAPVYVAGDGAQQERFWGLVATVIDVDELLQATGAHVLAGNLALAIRRLPDNGRPQQVFFGDTAVFESDAVRLLLTLPTGGWELAAHPHGSWPPSANTLRMLDVTILALALVAAGATHRSLRQWQDRERAHAQAEESRTRLLDAIESMSEGFALWDADDRLVLCNSRYRALLPRMEDLPQPGIGFESIVRRSVDCEQVAIEGDPREWIQRRLKAHRERLVGQQIELQDGRVLRCSEYSTADGGTLELYEDVTAMRRAEQDIRFRAFFDALTALPNRAYFLDQLDTAIARSRRSGRMLALLFVDLDRFKNVNDSLGHSLGDELIKQAAERIRGSLRASDVVARLGGDEFTVMITDLEDAMAPVSVAETLIKQLAQPYTLGHHEVFSAASIGITLCPTDATDAGTLLKNADMAMYQAKDAGRSTYRFFTPEMTERAQRFVLLEQQLRQALERRELSVHFQPIVDLATGKVVGAEALARWRRADGPEVSPELFIPVAEESGLIAEVGHRVLQMACDAAARWPESETRPYLAVNVSTRQFKADFDKTLVGQCLADSGFPADRLVLEITESALLEEDERTARSLVGFRELGIGVALDDFGTGYSSLSYLRRFPVTALKIDRSFVHDMARDENDARLVGSILAMAHTLGLGSVAEGVEGEAERRLLADFGCRLGQGNYFSPSLPTDQFAALLASGERLGGPQPDNEAAHSARGSGR